ncbi:MAG: helix-turn-helix transcriptional regulator [Pararhodobacter sp.]|nr:helix-turn-helix transcriptional regulator [Pararhodobacter sp.]
MNFITPKMPNDMKLKVTGFASAFDAGTLIPSHSHSAHQIAHAISGTMRVSVHNKMWFIPPGRALWITAQTPHAIQCVGPVEMRTAYLSEAYPPVYADAAVISVSPLMREVLVRLAGGDDSDLSLMLADVLVHEIRQGLSEPLHLPIPSNPHIAELAQHLQNEPADQSTLRTWAKRMGFSERNLIRTIRAETGMTFRELRRLTRIMIAIEKLSAGQSVTKTAFDVGYETPSAFTHAFRTLIGCSPLRFQSGRECHT